MEIWTQRCATILILVIVNIALNFDLVRMYSIMSAGLDMLSHIRVYRLMIVFFKLNILNIKFKDLTFLNIVVNHLKCATMHSLIKWL